MMRSLEEAMVNGRMGKLTVRLIGRPSSLRFRLARDTLGVMLLQGGSMGLGFVISVLLARTLGVKEFGLYSFAWSFLMLLSTPAAFGFPQLLVREIAANRAKGEWGAVHGIVRFSHRTALLVSLALMLFAGLWLWFLSGNLPIKTVTALAVALLGLPLLALVQLQGSALRGLDRILAGQAVEMLVRPVTFLLLFSGAWFLARELMSAPFALGLQVVAAGVALLAGGLLLYHYLTSQIPESSAIKSDPAWLRSALWLLLLALLGLIPQHAGVLLLGVMRGTEEVGLYKAAYQAAWLIPFGLMAVNMAITPTLAQLYASGEMQRLRRVVTAAAGAALFFALPLVLLYLLDGSWFLRFTFGEAFTASARALAILTIGQTVNVATGPVGFVLIMSGHERLATLSTGASAAANLLLGLLLIPFWGVQGAAVATAFGLITFNLLALYFIIARLKVVPFSFRPGG